MTGVDLGLDHPPPHRLLPDTDLLGDRLRGSRQRRILTPMLAHQTHRSGLQLRINHLRHTAHPPGLKQERHQTWGASVVTRRTNVPIRPGYRPHDTRLVPPRRPKPLTTATKISQTATESQLRSDDAGYAR